MKAIPKLHLLTPKIPRKPFQRLGVGTVETYDRLTLKVNDADNAKIRRGEHWEATVTDVPTGDVYKLRSSACALSCFCDAVVVEGPIPNRSN